MKTDLASSVFIWSVCILAWPRIISTGETWRFRIWDQASTSSLPLRQWLSRPKNCRNCFNRFPANQWRAASFYQTYKRHGSSKVIIKKTKMNHCKDRHSSETVDDCYDCSFYGTISDAKLLSCGDPEIPDSGSFRGSIFNLTPVFTPPRSREAARAAQWAGHAALVIDAMKATGPSPRMVSPDASPTPPWAPMRERSNLKSWEMLEYTCQILLYAYTCITY